MLSFTVVVKAIPKTPPPDKIPSQHHRQYRSLTGQRQEAIPGVDAGCDDVYAPVRQDLKPLHRQNTGFHREPNN